MADAVRSLRRSRLVSADLLDERLKEIKALNDRLVHLEDAGVRSDLETVAMIKDVCTGIWRIRRKIRTNDSAEPAPEMRGLTYALDKVWDSLANRGIEIQDHEGEPLSGGEDLNILTFQPTPGIGCEMVIETIKPTIYYKGAKIQAGDVIVGTPQAVKS